MFKELSQAREKVLSLRFYVWYSLLIGVAATFIGSRFIYCDPNHSALSFWQLIYFFTTFFGNYFFVTLILALVIALPFDFFRFKKTAKVLCFLIGLVVLFFLLADSYVFELYRVHLNLAMLQMTFLGGGRIVSFSQSMLIDAFLKTALLMAVTLVCLWLANRGFSKKITVFLFVLISLVFVADNFIHSYGFAKFDSKILSMNQKVPFSAPLRMNRRLEKLGILTKEEIEKGRYDFESSESMKYPLNPLVCTGGSKKNILFLFVDTLRADVFTPEIMPNTWEFAKENTVFTNNYSNGNNTRHGIFSLFTGLPGTYWNSALISHTPSILITALQDSGYEIGIFAGAPLNLPEFHTTIFSRVKDLRIWPRGEGSIQADKNAIEDFEKWQKSLPKDKPFFSFIFLDSVHAYAFPKEPKYEVFKPYWEKVNHMKLNNDFDPTEYFNTYKNAVHFSDTMIADVLNYLKSSGLLKDTIVVISSDHGDEFNDNKQNFWSHGGNFTDPQIKVPLVVHWPGKKPSQITYQTSLLDIVPTILPEVLGCKNPIEDYSVGQSIWDPNRKRNWFYSTGYSQSAFVEPSRIVLVNRLGALEFLDRKNRASKDKSMPDYLSEALTETTKYLKN